MYQLFIANKNYSSWSLRPWVLMRQLQIPFEERQAIFEQGTSWSAFRRFSPTGKVPCLVDGETTVWDSLAICEYLAERHAGVWPADPAARTWARCATAEMHSGFEALRSRCTMNCGIRVQVDPINPALQRDLDRLSELWRDGLERFSGPFLAGDHFTAVDAFFAPVALRIQTYNLILDQQSAAYAERLRELPSMLEWYAAALIEPWRDSAHELEAKATGRWLTDLRSTPQDS